MTVSVKVAMSLAILILVADSTGHVYAEEITLRCDPTEASLEPKIISIDLSKNSVHIGTAAESGWYYDGKQYTYDDGNNAPGNDCQIAYTSCTLKMTQFVHISSDKITYGKYGQNINNCGGHNYDHCTGGGLFTCAHCVDTGKLSYDIGGEKINEKSTINRNTGILEDDGIQYQCQLYKGKIF